MVNLTDSSAIAQWGGATSRCCLSNVAYLSHRTVIRKQWGTALILVGLSAARTVIALSQKSVRGQVWVVTPRVKTARNGVFAHYSSPTSISEPAARKPTVCWISSE